MTNITMILAIAVPLLFGSALPLIRFKERRHREIYVIAAVLLTSLLVLATLIWASGTTVTLIRLTKTLTVSLCLDGLSGAFADGRVRIEREGEIPKFVDAVSGLSFSVKNAHANHQEVLYITERCVFRLGEHGLVLTEVAPGIDVQTQILDLLPFAVEIAPDLKEMQF